ncbi:MAG: MBL fold metallo-hydrolase, partial [Pseudomonadota bacterium]|nr:MBL fold metallo-hydrolase [Pseudomonadota bacterium]
MKPSFQPLLANDPFADPVLLLDFVFARRALLFDAGDLRAIPTRKLLRVSDVFVSHRHMDHFADFDWLLRLNLGRPKRLRVYGPEGLVDAIGHKLAAYSWNLVANYAEAMEVEAIEMLSSASARRVLFRCQNRF